MPSRNNTIFGALGRNAVHPFPARMAPELVCDLIRNSPRPIRILDPMMGSGTVLALAQSQNHRAVGVDIDPLAVLISRVWTTPNGGETVIRIARAVLKRAIRHVEGMPLSKSYPNGANSETRRFIRYWFDPQARRQLAALSLAISRVRNANTKDVLWCAFSRLIIAKSSGASRALDLAHSRPHRHFKTAPANPFDKFLHSIQFVLKNSLVKYRRSNGPKTIVREGDARRLPLSANSIDLVVTSPPYLNAIDYIRCSKFSLVWMGYEVSDLSAVRKRSVGTEVGRDLAQDVEVLEILKNLRISKLPRRRSAIIAAYVDDMRMAIDEVARVLVPGGKAVYVIGENTIRGVYVKNSEILTALEPD
jgi:hypothetical protein